MQKTISVHISGRSFYMDEDAHARLNSYLNKLQSRYGKVEGGTEIISDIESRIAELFSQKIDSATSVVTLALVEEVIRTMGEPDEFEQSSTKTGKQTTTNSQPWIRPAKKLYRDPDNRMLGGVCAGLAAYFGADVSLVRVLAVIITILTSFSGAILYVVLWAVLPEALTPSQKLEMRGENINIENIERAVREEFDEVKKGFSRMKESQTVQQGKNYFERLNQRDRTVLTVVGIIIGLVLISNVFRFGMWPFFHFSFNNFHWPFFHHFPFMMVFPGIIILIGLLILSKSAPKGLIIALTILFILFILIPLIVFMAGGFAPFIQL